MDRTRLKIKHKVGIVAEFNPLHNGHIGLINEAKRNFPKSPIIIVMSGNYVQRGEPSLIDKKTRTQMVLKAGADLVIELPPSHAINSADYFAKYAIDLLAQLGVTDLFFGTERHNYNYNDINFSTKQTTSFIYNQTVADFLTANNQHIFNRDEPNHLLAVSYAKAIDELNFPIKLHSVKRDRVNNPISSSNFRERIINNEDFGQLTASYVVKEIKEIPKFVTWNDFFSVLQGKIITESVLDLKKYKEVNEGLEYRIKKYAAANNFTDLLKQVKHKRLTQAHLRRVLLGITLGYKYNITINETNNYIKVLGLNQLGKLVIKQANSQSKYPIIVKHKKEYLKNELYNFNFQSDLLYNTVSCLNQIYQESVLIEE